MSGSMGICRLQLMSLGAYACALCASAQFKKSSLLSVRFRGQCSVFLKTKADVRHAHAEAQAMHVVDGLGSHLIPPA